MRVVPIYSCIFMIIVAAQIAAALGFVFYSDGFYSLVNGALFHCRELMSSGSDDEVTMFVFILQFLSIALRMNNIKKTPSYFEVGLYLFFIIIGILIVVISSDCGSLLTTMVLKRDPYLISFSLAGVVAFTLLALLSRQNE